MNLNVDRKVDGRSKFGFIQSWNPSNLSSCCLRGPLLSRSKYQPEVRDIQ